LELKKSKPYAESDLSKLAAAAFQSYAKGNLPELLKTSDGAELSPSNYAEGEMERMGRCWREEP